MSVLDTMRIAASGMTAQRLRMDVAASNLANADTTRTADGTPWTPGTVVFATDATVGADAATPGVAATAVASATGWRRAYDPAHPDADADGYVTLPNVDLVAEMGDVMGAARSYGIDSTVAQAAKGTALDALDIR